MKHEIRMPNTTSTCFRGFATCKRDLPEKCIELKDLRAEHDLSLGASLDFRDVASGCVFLDCSGVLVRYGSIRYISYYILSHTCNSQ